MCNGGERVSAISTGAGSAEPSQQALETPAHEPLLLCLLVQPGEPFRGSLRAPDAAASVPFQGWIDFMAALNGLRSNHPVPKPGQSRS